MFSKYLSLIHILVHKVSGKRPIHIVLPMWFAKGTAGLSELYYKLLHQKPLYTLSLIHILVGRDWQKQRVVQSILKDVRDDLHDDALVHRILHEKVSQDPRCV